MPFKTFAGPKRLINAVVVSSGLMEKTVKVRVGAKKLNIRVNKVFNRDEHFLVHDPNSSLRTGDIVEIEPGWRCSKRVRHVVTRILSPFGSRVEDRPPVPTEEQRIEQYKMAKKAKDERRRLRKYGLVDADGNLIAKPTDGNLIEKPKPILQLKAGKDEGLTLKKAGVESTQKEREELRKRLEDVD